MQLHLLEPCTICGKPASVREMSAPGGPRWLCRDHLPDDAGDVLDTIEELRRKQEPTPLTIR
jgi:hypothetical protein